MAIPIFLSFEGKREIFSSFDLKLFVHRKNSNDMISDWLFFEREYPETKFVCVNLNPNVLK